MVQAHIFGVKVGNLSAIMVLQRKRMNEWMDVYYRVDNLRLTATLPSSGSCIRPDLLSKKKGASENVCDDNCRMLDLSNLDVSSELSKRYHHGLQVRDIPGSRDERAAVCSQILTSPPVLLASNHPTFDYGFGLDKAVCHLTHYCVLAECRFDVSNCGQFTRNYVSVFALVFDTYVILHSSTGSLERIECGAAAGMKQDQDRNLQRSVSVFFGWQ